jgi:hypothetical protein
VNIINKLRFPKPSEVYDTFWRFAAERQEIFFRRLCDTQPPWTTDPILAAYKFTNVYRASDRTSQFLIKNVLYRGDQSHEETFFRCILFKIFNRQSTWELLETTLGEVRYSTYSFKRYDDILRAARDKGKRIFSAAYIMPTRAADLSDSAKHRNYLRLLERMMRDRVPSQLAELKSMAGAFTVLRGYPLFGDFLAYQLVTDINYSKITNFSEMEFVMPGPGARNGIRKCFSTMGELSESDVIRFMADRQNDEFSRLNLRFRSLWGRPLQLIDCQNLFCEVDKYARVAHPNIMGLTSRKRIKQKFTRNSQPIQYQYPPKWGINNHVESGRKEIPKDVRR